MDAQTIRNEIMAWDISLTDRKDKPTKDYCRGVFDALTDLAVDINDTQLLDEIDTLKAKWCPDQLTEERKES